MVTHNTPISQEEQLSTNWLNCRENYDADARNQAIFELACSQLPINRTPVITDLGSGTGNNVFWLIRQLPCSARLIVVEQHQYLIDECRRRLIETFDIVRSQPDQLNLSNRELCFKVEFIKCNVLSWLQQQESTDLYTANALLDLFTLAELDRVVSHIGVVGIPLYATLNYTGVHFHPSAHNDAHYISQFELHMSRQLDRGKPLGAGVIAAVEKLTAGIRSLNLVQSNSDWSIPEVDNEFLRMNIAFYKTAVELLLNSGDDIAEFSDWIDSKIAMIDAGALGLTVHHQDILLTRAGTVV